MTTDIPRYFGHYASLVPFTHNWQLYIYDVNDNEVYSRSCRGCGVAAYNWACRFLNAEYQKLGDNLSIGDANCISDYVENINDGDRYELDMPYGYSIKIVPIIHTEPEFYI